MFVHRLNFFEVQYSEAWGLESLGEIFVFFKGSIRGNVHLISFYNDLVDFQASGVKVILRSSLFSLFKRWWNIQLSSYSLMFIVYRLCTPLMILWRRKFAFWRGREGEREREAIKERVQIGPQEFSIRTGWSIGLSILLCNDMDSNQRKIFDAHSDHST